MKQRLSELREALDALEDTYADYEINAFGGLSSYEDVISKEKIVCGMLSSIRKYGYINDIGSFYGFGIKEGLTDELP